MNPAGVALLRMAAQAVLKGHAVSAAPKVPSVIVSAKNLVELCDAWDVLWALRDEFLAYPEMFPDTPAVQNTLELKETS